MYVDEFMNDTHHYQIFVPSDPGLQKHFLHIYHDSPMGMHRGHDAHDCLSCDLLAQYVEAFAKMSAPLPALHQIQIPSACPWAYADWYPFHTIGVDYVGELPHSPSGNKWILTAVCHFQTIYGQFQCQITQLQQQPRPFLTMFFSC